MIGESTVPTPWAVWCHEEKALRFLTEQEYDRQMRFPNSRWKCPRCYSIAGWDDDNYEEWLDKKEQK